MGKIEKIVADDEDDSEDIPAWHIEAIEEALSDPRPGIPAEEFFAQMRLMIAEIVARR